MRVFHPVLFGTLLLPLVARGALPPKDESGGISLNAWFSPKSYGDLGVSASNEGEYCELFQATSDRLWIATEGQHYLKHVSFMIGEVQPGVRLYKGSGRGNGSFGGRIIFPHTLPFDLEEASQTMNHEMGHYFYSLPDEYVEGRVSSVGFCADETYGDIGVSGCTSVPESSCASGAQCRVLDGCIGGDYDGMICDYTPGALPPNYLFIDEADCVSGGGSCLKGDPGVCLLGDDAGAPCEKDDDCGGATWACSSQRDETLSVDIPEGEDSCLMANQYDKERWCAANHRHSIEFENVISLDQSSWIAGYVLDGLFAGPGDFNCWDVAQHYHADLSWPGNYSTEIDLGLPPPIDCTWAIDDLQLAGSTALVVDTSGSMLEDDAWSYAVDGAEYLNAAALADPNDANVGLYHFDSEFHPLPHDSLDLSMGPVQDLGDGVDDMALEAYMNENRKTHICEALENAAAELAGTSVTDRKIVLLTDGVDTSPTDCDPVAVAADLCASGISVHALAYGAADVAATQAMTQAGCGGMKYAPPGFLGLSGVHALQMGLARVGSMVDGDIEMLYERQMVSTGLFGEVVDKEVLVPERSESLTLTWMGNDQQWFGMPLFNQVAYTVTTPSGTVIEVSGGAAETRARYRSKTFENPEPGVWRMTVDAKGLAITTPIDVEIGWLAAISADAYSAEAWVLHPSGVLGQPVPIRAAAGLMDENLTRLEVTAEVVYDDQRWPITLFDDGFHGDDAHGDGIYGGSFVPVEVGPHGVEVSFAVMGGVSRTVPSSLGTEDDFIMRADTAFQVLPDEPLLGIDANGAPLQIPDLYQGGVYPNLRTNLYGVPLSAANTVLSLGAGVEIENVVISCPTCAMGDDHDYEIRFDAVVSADAALGPRDLTVQVGATQYRLQDATEVIAAAVPRVFRTGELVVSEVMTAPVGDGEWFEIYNPSSVAVDLYGIEIWDYLSEVVRVEHPVVVPAKGYALFSTDAGMNPAHRYEGMRLDAVDSLIVFSGLTTVDSVSWTRKFPVVSAASMTLDRGRLSATSNNTSTYWCASQVAYGSAGNKGTPGTQNELCLRLGPGR